MHFLGITGRSNGKRPGFVYTESLFAWDTRKATGNYAKHGVAFEEAATVFGDPDALDGSDLSHPEKESRFL